MEQPLVKQPDEYSDDDERNSHLGLGTVLLLLVLIAAMLTTLVGPVLWQVLYRLNAPPTPTPIFMHTV